MEVLLELCDENLDVETTADEVRELTGVYWEAFKAQPFLGLRELLEADTGMAAFFDMFKEQVLPIRRVDERHQKTLSVYRQFIEVAKTYPQTPHVQALLNRAHNVILFNLNYKLMVQRPKAAKTWIQ
jgi:hypothetical protein